MQVVKWVAELTCGALTAVHLTLPLFWTSKMRARQRRAPNVTEGMPGRQRLRWQPFADAK